MAFKITSSKGPKGAVKAHHEPYLDIIKRIVKESDLVLEILDARLIQMSRNEYVEKLIEEMGRPVIFVINKSDLTNRESIVRQMKNLKKKGEVVFINARNPANVKILLYKIRKVFKKYGKREMEIRTKFDPKPKFREARADIVVGVLGYPNVGKSSIINSLCHKRKTPVSKKAGTTHGLHWIRVNDEIKVIDSPGIIPLVKEDEVRYGLISAKDSERLKQPEFVAEAIIKMFFENDKKRFEEFYGIEFEGDDFYDIIEKLAKKRGHLLRGGVIDENRTINQIVRDWQHGKLTL